MQTDIDFKVREEEMCFRANLFKMCDTVGSVN